MTLFAPSSYQELGVMLHDALDLCTGPATIRWSKTAAPSVSDDEVGSGLSARQVRAGRDICILAVGKMVAAARDAAEALAADGIEATVWDVRVVPLDPKMLTDAAEHPVVLTAEDGVREGGVGSMIADALSGGPAGAGPRHPHRVHPARQARSDPRRPRPRRQRPRARGPSPRRLPAHVAPQASPTRVRKASFLRHFTPEFTCVHQLGCETRRSCGTSHPSSRWVGGRRRGGGAAG